RLRQQERKGLIGHDVAQADVNKLINSLLDFLGEIPRQVSREMSPAPIIKTESIAVSLPADFSLEKIIGINNLKQISWLQRAIEVSKSVCRILTPDGVGTGFLISPNILMTNNHVIPTIDVAKGSIAEFNYQQDGAGKYLATSRYHFDAKVFYTSGLN